MAQAPKSTTINISPHHQPDFDQEMPLFEGEKKESPSEEFIRQKNIAEEACQLGRKLLTDKDYTNASKQFSKAVMTFEYILKNNPKMSHLKEEIAQMVKYVIQPAYSNLSLCYLKMQHWNLVINFTNQVLQTDPSNLKNLYRRGIARKMSKLFDQAIQDFEKVTTYDKQMKGQCNRLIVECRQLRKEERKKSKQIAKQFIHGYAQAKPDPKPVLTPEVAAKKESWWAKGLNLVKSCCPRLFRRN